jgi:hypothetical protein
MNEMNPDRLYSVNLRKIEKDQAFILKEEMLKSRSGLTSFLNGLGGWMVRSGEKLKKRNSFSAQVRRLDSLQDASRIFKA